MQTSKSILAVVRSRVDEARAGFERNVIAEDDRDLAVVEGDA